MTTVGSRNVSHCQQQKSYSELRSPGRSNSTYLFTQLAIIPNNHLPNLEDVCNFFIIDVSDGQ